MQHHTTLLKALLLSLILIFSFSRCSNDPAGADNEYRRYVVDMMDSVREDALYADRVDWDSLEDAFQPMFDTITSYAGAHSIIQQMIWAMEDRNAGTYFGDGSHKGDMSAKILPVEVKIFDDKISYLLVPRYFGPESGVKDYMTELCEAIDSIRGHSTKGVILDLRWHSGGHIYATMAGLRPFLPEKNIGYVLGKNLSRTPLSFNDGAIYYGDEQVFMIPEGCRQDGAARQFDNVPIVVLAGQSTVTTGEMILASLKSRGNVYVIGEKTYGAPFWATAKSLPDGSAVWYSTGTFADSKGEPITTAITPDEVSVMETDELVRRATEHLKSL